MREDLSGKKFGLLLVVKDIGKRKNEYLWLCVCECGKETVGRGNNLKHGTKKSCGCLKTKETLLHKQKHYIRWSQMLSRCYKESNKDYHRYGAKGVVVCDEWKNDYWAFHKWVEDSGFKEGLTIDRFPDRDGDYSPENCRLATYIQQNNNLRSNRRITISGVTKTFTEWVRYYGIPERTVRGRMSRGLDILTALTTKENLRWASKK